MERVRAEAMAMRSSDDLLKVVAVLSDELKRDDSDRRWCNINFFDEETDQITQYNGVDNPKLYAPVELAPDVLKFSDDVIAYIHYRNFAGETPQGDDMTCGVLGVERDPILDAVAIDREERIRLYAGGALDK